MKDKSLYRSRTNRILAGVCGGLGEYFEIDAWIVRIFFILMHGAGLLLYIILALFVPENPAEAKVTAKEKVVPHDLPHDKPVIRASAHRENWLAIFLIVVGLLFLAESLALIPARWDLIWPIALIFFGLYLLSRRRI